MPSLSVLVARCYAEEAEQTDRGPDGKQLLLGVQWDVSIQKMTQEKSFFLLW